jgi:hypothetical protein
MALPITVPFTFGNATTTQSLSSLDADFSTVYNAVNGIGNGTVSLSNVSITGGTIANAAITGSVSYPENGYQRNRIINGAMQISQRGTSFSTPVSLAYTIDRWFIGWGGAAPATVAQVSNSAGYRNAFQATGAASNTVLSINQRIESYNCSDLSGATVTFQANITVSTPQTVSWSLSYPTAQDNYTSMTTISAGTWSATATATTFTATITSLPAGAVNGLQLAFYPNNGGAFTSGTITITGVQLEVGSVATPFERRQYGTELMLCQRYYTIVGGNLVGALNNSGNVAAFAYLPANPRTTPSVSYTGTAQIIVFGVGTYSSTTQPSGISCSGNNMLFTITGFGATPTTGFGQVANTIFNASMEL